MRLSPFQPDIIKRLLGVGVIGGPLTSLRRNPLARKSKKTEAYRFNGYYYMLKKSINKRTAGFAAFLSLASTSLLFAQTTTTPAANTPDCSDVPNYTDL